MLPLILLVCATVVAFAVTRLLWQAASRPRALEDTTALPAVGAQPVAPGTAAGGALAVGGAAAPGEGEDDRDQRMHARRQRLLEAEQRAAEREELEEQRLADEAAEAERVAAERRAAAEHEFSEWRGLVEVAEKGERVQSDAPTPRDVVRAHLLRPGAPKGTTLTEVAAATALPVDTVLAEVRALVATGGLRAVFDDRGGILTLTSEDLAAVRRILVTRGRVSLDELVRECGRALGT